MHWATRGLHWPVLASIAVLVLSPLLQLLTGLAALYA